MNYGLELGDIWNEVVMESETSENLFALREWRTTTANFINCLYLQVHHGLRWKRLPLLSNAKNRFNTIGLCTLKCQSCRSVCPCEFGVQHNGILRDCSIRRRPKFKVGICTLPEHTSATGFEYSLAYDDKSKSLRFHWKV
nr:hypothetical protein [Tanacetum cinerariifolium]